MKTALFFFLLLMPFQVGAAEYEVDHTNSTLRFSGTHAGIGFSGGFADWSATISFDKADLPGARFSASFNPATAKTGNPLFDGTLPQADWFDTSNHKQALFASTSVSTSPVGGDNYTMHGLLTIRGISKPISFNFTFLKGKGERATARASLEIDRLAFDIGKKSDAKAEWVSRMISLQLDLQLIKK